MTDTYALEAYAYEGEFYLVGNGHGKPSDVLEHIAADHIMAIERTRHIEEYLLDALKTGENVRESVYEEAYPDVECGIHVDVDYQRISFWAGDDVVKITSQPTNAELKAIAAGLRSRDINGSSCPGQ